MRKLLLVGVCCLAFNMTLRAQQYSKGYLDSVKSFCLEYFSIKKIPVNSLLLDNSSNDVQLKDDLGLKQHQLWSSKTKRNPNGGFRLRIDSIMFTEKETNYIISRILDENPFRWSNEYFPKMKIVKQKGIDSLNRINDKLRNEVGSLNTAMQHDPMTQRQTDSLQKVVVEKNNARMDRDFFKQGYWIISLPVFLRNSTYAVIYYRHMSGDHSGSEELSVYKNNKGKWEYFGSIVGGVTN